MPSKKKAAAAPSKAKGPKQAKVPTVRKILNDILQECYDDNTLHDMDFDKVKAEVLRHHPDSRFNPTHMAWYKTMFLKGRNADGTKSDLPQT